jgi:hypothetical protein
MLDCHVAEIYGKETFNFNLQIERNKEYFKEGWIPCSHCTRAGYKRFLWFIARNSNNCKKKLCRHSRFIA